MNYSAGKKWIFIVLLCAGSAVHAYETSTHTRMTRLAFERSVMATDPSFFWHLGIGVDPDSPADQLIIEYPDEAAEDWGIDTDEELEFYGVKDILAVTYYNADSGEQLTDPVELSVQAYHRLAVLAEPEALVRIRAITEYEDLVMVSTFWTSAVRTWLSEEAVTMEVPGIGFRTQLRRTWTYTPVHAYRGARGMIINPFLVELGETADMDVVWALPDIGPGAPSPINVLQ